MIPVADWLPTDLHKTKAINELAGCAAPLLTIAYQLTEQVEPLDNTLSLIEVILNEAKLFYKKAHNVGYSAQHILASRYWLCATLDELILGLPNPNKTQYPSLLKSLNHSSSDQFLPIIKQQQLSSNPSADVLEIAYLCLCLNISNHGTLSHINNPEIIQEKILKQTLAIRNKTLSTTIKPTKKITQSIIFGSLLLTMFSITLIHHNFEKKLEHLNETLPETILSD